IFVQAFSRVFLQMRARQADALLALARDDRDLAARDDRDLILRDLIALRQIRIEVVLASENASTVDRSADGEAESDRPLDGTLVQYGKNAGQRNVDRGRVRVRRGAERSRCAGKDFRRRGKLRVRFQSDDDLPAHDVLINARRASMPLRHLLIAVRDIEDARLVEMMTLDLHADRQSVARETA